ncbi:Ferredoxin [Rhizobium sp. RU33A]|uniref:4Fe-4S dicluster domain-containing protein n=1 Tax=Rhizobium sp. RU33A TaxID=1907413 RepID=UPI00095590A4|nr:4Fe-4S dicluster domain-containing protein [Rhizobium sp. RU33A]SIQ92450.1 Ferredoxin [Rhizobium sp. RU33A]
MSGPSGVLATLDARLAEHGLAPRGLLRFGQEDQAPLLADSAPAEAVLLIGVVGGATWPHFERWRTAQADHGGADPLDRWSKTVIDQVAEEIGAQACYPSEAPYQPFQRWAMWAEGLQASPLGILIHPRFGLWHSYRGALLFRNWDEAQEGPAMTGPHPCEACHDKPCLTACPVGAISLDGFDVAACRAHLASPEGQGGCMVSGCLARNACPVGADYRYPNSQLRFHMQALKLPG